MSAESVLDALVVKPAVNATTIPDQKVNDTPQTIEDVIKSLVGFSQVVSHAIQNIWDRVHHLTGVVEAQTKEIAQLRDLIKSDDQENTLPATSDGDKMDKIDESEEEYVTLLNKMQMRRDALKNPAVESECKKESRAVTNAKVSILAAAKHQAHLDNPE